MSERPVREMPPIIAPPPPPSAAREAPVIPLPDEYRGPDDQGLI